MIEPYLPESRILLVDDEPGAIRVMRNMLSEFRELTFARSGAEALRQIRASRPDLVIVDVNMPGMSGLQLCDQLQADPELKDIPVIVATAEQLTSVESAALQRGAVDFVTKPLVPETSSPACDVICARANWQSVCTRASPQRSPPARPARRLLAC
ncbi:MAG: response regulator [Roseateles sp.]|uniref:response regulator n=1 Tax=Roseateles sp. TaxID=1971397 RepID=UPI0040370553